MRIPLAKAGRREMFVMTLICHHGAGFAVIAALAGAIWGWPVAAFCLIVWVAGLAFFRDPERETPDEPGILVSPADGKIVETADLDQHAHVEGPATRISIFLSVLDVHINRSPCAGVVRSVDYQPGKFLDARNEQSGKLNEANTIVIDPDAPDAGPVVVRQIAGLIARRIVCSVEPGDRVEAGQRIGLIKFGSRTELIVPAASRYVPAVSIAPRRGSLGRDLRHRDRRRSRRAHRGLDHDPQRHARRPAGPGLRPGHPASDRRAPTGRLHN